MNNKSKSIILGLFLFLTFSVYSKVFNIQTPKDFFSINVASVRVAELVASSSRIFSIDTRIKTQNCLVNGPYPDHECTPGAIFEGVGTTTVCVHGYTKTVRNVSTSLKKRIYQSYGVPYPQPFGSYEVDHLIPLGIGGSNDVANLFPEAGEPYPGFKEKDVVENFLRREVCSGRIDLYNAQKQIANDWLSVYNALSESEINALKAEFKSWADKN